MPNWNGKTLGKVNIGEFIARGGMAEVYIGEHTTLHRKVAVKIMRDYLDDDPTNQKRFEREARVIASLRHPNIIQVFDYELVDGQPCLIMELVPGASLGNYLKSLHERKQKLPLKMAAHIISALASAIDYAHSKHIVHRDIKPANVLLRSASGPVEVDGSLPEDVEPILTDFGLVRLLDSSVQSSTGSVSGTPAYMSPEQARGDKVDGRTDIYSLGVMLYEMLAGVVPFDADSSFGVLMKHLNDTPPPIFGISSDLQLIVNRALAKNTDIRYATAKELADEFTAVINGKTVSADTIRLLNTAKETAEHPAKQPRTFPCAWAGIGTLLAIGLAVVAFRFWPSTKVIDKNQPIGHVSYSDFYSVMDKATISTSDLPMPNAGSHYEAWYIAKGGTSRRNMGTIKIDATGQGQLIYTDSERGNILSSFDQLEVTLEADNDTKPDESSGNVIASSLYPPLAFVHLEHLLVASQFTPDQTALIQGLWGTADTVNTSATELDKAFSDGDEKLVRLKTEEIINQLAGDANTDQYKDWNKNGKVDDPSDGFGLLENGDQGYITQTIAHANFAAQSADATDNIKSRSANIAVCSNNLKSWSEQLLEKALELQGMPFGSEMEPLVVDISALTNQIVSGTDANGNGLIEAVSGEGGADTVYNEAYNMAEMPLLMGAHRIPPPASK